MSRPPKPADQGAARVRIDALLRRALDTSGTTEEERRTAAIVAVQTAQRAGLAIFPTTAPSSSSSSTSTAPVVLELEQRLARAERLLRQAAALVEETIARAERAESERDELARGLDAIDQRDELELELEGEELERMGGELFGEPRGGIPPWPWGR